MTGITTPPGGAASTDQPPTAPDAADRLITAEEFLAMPDDGLRRELVDGRLTPPMSPAFGEHGEIATALLGRLVPHVWERRLGRVYDSSTGFVLARNPDRVRAPDVAFVAAANLPARIRVRGFVEGPPDLAVEIVSPNDLLVDLEDRVAEFLAAGALAVWVINPRRRTVTMHGPDGAHRVVGEDATLDGGDIVPGFAMPVRDLFAWPV